MATDAETCWVSNLWFGFGLAGLLEFGSGDSCPTSIFNLRIIGKNMKSK